MLSIHFVINIQLIADDVIKFLQYLSILDISSHVLCQYRYIRIENA